MAWIVLVVAGGLEIVWYAALKLSEGFTRPVWIAVIVPASMLSFWLLAQAMQHIPIGTAYPVWVGIGAIGAFAVGALWFGEAVSPLRLASVALILTGIAGLKVAA
jgi:quaternary ammonium compound-resistance protein SugE